MLSWLATLKSSSMSMVTVTSLLSNLMIHQRSRFTACHALYAQDNNCIVKYDDLGSRERHW